MAIVWIVVTVALLAVELHHLAFFAMFGAAGALAAAVVAVFFPTAVALQIIVAIAIAAVGVVGVRPHMSQAFARRGPGVTIGGVHGGLIGARGLALDEISPGHTGHIRLLGETWLAVTTDDPPIPPSTPVIVTKVVGTTLTVRPAAEYWELT